MGMVAIPADCWGTICELGMPKRFPKRLLHPHSAALHTATPSGVSARAPCLVKGRVMLFYGILSTRLINYLIPRRGERAPTPALTSHPCTCTVRCVVRCSLSHRVEAAECGRKVKNAVEARAVHYREVWTLAVARGGTAWSVVKLNC